MSTTLQLIASVEWSFLAVLRRSTRLGSKPATRSLGRYYHCKNFADLPRYHIPSHLSQHIDFVQPGVMVSAPVKKLTAKRTLEAEEIRQVSDPLTYFLTGECTRFGTNCMTTKMPSFHHSNTQQSELSWHNFLELHIDDVSYGRCSITSVNLAY